MSKPDKIAAGKLRTAFDLFVAGERMMLQNLKRRHPEASESEIESRLRDWMRRRPGAEYGDADGRPIRWPRTGLRAT